MKNKNKLRSEKVVNQNWKNENVEEERGQGGSELCGRGRKPSWPQPAQPLLPRNPELKKKLPTRVVKTTRPRQ
jgi:hypothetical protein